MKLLVSGVVVPGGMEPLPAVPVLPPVEVVTPVVGEVIGKIIKEFMRESSGELMNTAKLT